MAHVCGRGLRALGLMAAVCGALLVGCSGSGSTSGAEARKPVGSAASGGADDADAQREASPTVVWDPARQPRTARQAEKLIRKVIAGPELIGPGVVRAMPYEGDPSRWAVLGKDCVWRQEPLPKDVLATLTRYFQVPAEDGKGSVRLSATVSVHRTSLAADWAQAGMLEEVMGCGATVPTAPARTG